MFTFSQHWIIRPKSCIICPMIDGFDSDLEKAEWKLRTKLSSGPVYWRSSCNLQMYIFEKWEFFFYFFANFEYLGVRQRSFSIIYTHFYSTYFFMYILFFIFSVLLSFLLVSVFVYIALINFHLVQFYRLIQLQLIYFSCFFKAVFLISI